MQFRDLKSQYRALKPQMDEAIQAVLDSSDYIAGDQCDHIKGFQKAFIDQFCLLCKIDLRFQS